MDEAFMIFLVAILKVLTKEQQEEVKNTLKSTIPQVNNYLKNDLYFCLGNIDDKLWLEE